MKATESWFVPGRPLGLRLLRGWWAIGGIGLLLAGQSTTAAEPGRTSVAIAANEDPATDAHGTNVGEGIEWEAVRRERIRRGIGYLRAAQRPDGAFSSESAPPNTAVPFTALALTALVQNGVTPADDAIVRGLAYLQNSIHDDGGIYHPESTHRNYETSVTCMCMAAVRDYWAQHPPGGDARIDVDAERARYQAILHDAAKFLKADQWDEGEGVTSADAAYGGAGYGSHERPDLSNTSYLIDALKALGTSPDDEAIQRAILFVSRCQNLESPQNTTEFASKNPDGGFYYSPAAGGSSQAGTTESGGLRSYASMTYAGLRSMLYAGVDRDDARVVAARNWLAQNYSVATNPGLGDQGLFYYFHTFAKTMDAWSEPEFIDSRGESHDWKTDLVTELARRQQPNGSWINNHPRWLEDNPILVTSYSLLALSYCQKSPQP